MNKTTRQSKKTQESVKQPIAVVESWNNKWTWFVLALVLVSTLLIYFQSIGLAYVWDDYWYICDNKDLVGFSWHNIQKLCTGFYAGNYQPLTMLMYVVENNVVNEPCALFHFNNVILHLLNTYLVFVLIRKISPQNIEVALITAAFFAVHPMHVESVAWISERKDVLYSFFFLLSLIQYCHFLQSRKGSALAFSAVFFVLSCLSKSAAVILPLVMLLFDYYTDRKFSWKMILEKLPFFAISILFGIVAMNTQKDSIQQMAPVMTFAQHLSVISFSFMDYFSKAFIPVHLSAFYPYPIEIENGMALPTKYFLSFIFLLLLLFIVWYSRKRGKHLIFGLLFFVITIVLVLQFVLVGAASMADRYTYIPYIGVFFVFGKAYEHLCYKVYLKSLLLKRVLMFILLIYFVSFSVLAYQRVKVWKNAETLFSDVIETYPNENSTPYINRGYYYHNYYVKKLYADNPVQRELYTKKVIQDLENALRFPVPRTIISAIYYKIGTCKGDLSDFRGSIAALDESIKFDERSSASFSCRATAKNILKDYRGALSDYTKAIELYPDDAVNFYNRGVTQSSLGDYRRAILDFDIAIKMDRKYGDAFFNRAFAKHQLADFKGAIDDYTRVIELNPNDVDAIKNRTALKSTLMK